MPVAALRNAATPYLAGLHAKLEEANGVAKALGLCKSFALADVRTGGFDIKVAIMSDEGRVGEGWSGGGEGQGQV